MADSTSSNSGFATGGEHPGFSNRPHFEGYEGVSSSVEGVGAMVSRYASSYDKSLRANPYLHIGIAGVGALAVGYLLGRAFTPSTSPSIGMIATEFDIDEGYDE